jgi:DNA repair protein RadA/Sms
MLLAERSQRVELIGVVRADQEEVGSRCATVELCPTVERPAVEPGRQLKRRYAQCDNRQQRQRGSFNEVAARIREPIHGSPLAGGKYATRPEGSPVTHSPIYRPAVESQFGYPRAMPKHKRVYTCDSCGAVQPKWQGQCPDCGAWNSLTETASFGGARAERARDVGAVTVARLDQLDVSHADRLGTGLGEFDRVLGGGLVPGGVVLLGGDPGIGKSTLLLRALADCATRVEACYVTGEESLDQVALRAQRLGVGTVPLELVAETCVETVLGALATRRGLAVLAIDSIQTLFSGELESAPGSVSQLRECTAQLVRHAKAHNVATLLVGHVTKEGTLAGPRVLEHMVDTVLYFESDVGSRFRIVRAVKNRFGAANEMGFFVMGEDGFREVKNPSAIFLARRSSPVPGSATLVTREGTRPVLVEVQALVDATRGQAPRRLAQGFDGQRLALLLAVLHRHTGFAAGDGDVFANIVGGLRVAETAADLAVALAIVSSAYERPVPQDLAVFGEIGLTGEIRPVPFGEERLTEAQKHGFKRALVPRANLPRRSLGLDVVPVDRVSDALAVLGS